MDIATAPERTAANAEWQARADLAAVYRLLDHHGWGDVIFNRAAMRCPSSPRNSLIKRHELLYTEVTASNLVEGSYGRRPRRTLRRRPPGLYAA